MLKNSDTICPSCHGISYMREIAIGIFECPVCERITRYYNTDIIEEMNHQDFDWTEYGDQPKSSFRGEWKGVDDEV